MIPAQPSARSTHFSCVSKLIGQNQHINTGKNDYFILKANHEVAFWIHPPDGNQPKTRCFVRRRVLKWFAWPHMLLAFLNVCREGIISTFSASLYVAFFVTCTTWRRECCSDNLRRVSHAMSMSCLKVTIFLMCWNVSCFTMFFFNVLNMNEPLFNSWTWNAGAKWWVDAYFFPN